MRDELFSSKNTSQRDKWDWITTTSKVASPYGDCPPASGSHHSKQFLPMILSLLTTPPALPTLLLLCPEIFSASRYVQHFKFCFDWQFLNLLAVFLYSHCISVKWNRNKTQALVEVESGILSTDLFHIWTGLRPNSRVTLFHAPCEY